jgi:hypothetical protein
VEQRREGRESRTLLETGIKATNATLDHLFFNMMPTEHIDEINISH